MLVLGKVGEVPVLALLVGGVLLGALLGGVLVCLCSKACEKRRVVYDPVPGIRPTSLPQNDYIREPKASRMAEERSSGIGSAFSTLKTDNGSINSINQSTRLPTQPSVNNLSRGTTGHPSGTTDRCHNGTEHNMLNITNSSSMTHCSTNRSTGSTNGSSLNKNTNRSPNIPYTKTLGTLTGHQATSTMLREHDVHHEYPDSDDSNYDKPYVSSPLLADNYSVPHATQMVRLERQPNTIITDKPADRQVPRSQYATFLK